MSVRWGGGGVRPPGYFPIGPTTIKHRRHQRCEPRHQVQRLEHEVGRAIAVRSLERIADLPRSRQRQTHRGDGRDGSVGRVLDRQRQQQLQRRRDGPHPSRDHLPKHVEGPVERGTAEEHARVVGRDRDLAQQRHLRVVERQ